MKLILILVCGVTFFQTFASGRLNLSSDGIVGVSQKNLQEYMKKAFEGFKKIMKQGDEELNYPVMEPYKLEPFSWDYVDTSGSKKYKLTFFNTNSALLKGLSNYRTRYVNVDAKEMKLAVKLDFNGLQTEFPYKLEGYLFKNLIPVYGEGLVKLSTKLQRLNIFVDLAIDRGYITSENVQIIRSPYDADVKVTGLMDLPDSFASAFMDNILNQIVKQHADDALKKFARTIIEETIGGMTTDEFFELLDHFVKKNDSTQ